MLRYGQNRPLGKGEVDETAARNGKRSQDRQLTKRRGEITVIRAACVKNDLGRALLVSFSRNTLPKCVPYLWLNV